MQKLSFKFLLLCLLAISSCKKEEEPRTEKLNTLPEFYKPAEVSKYGTTHPEFALIANIFQTISTPQDLDFNPTRNMELWVINKDIEATGGSTVTIYNAGKENQTSQWRRDGNAWHFMSLPSSLAFSDNGNWASAHNVQDANHQGGTFTGPSLWSSDPAVYARPSGGNGSHLDMVHSSPFGMGIASENDHVFWVFDGYNGHLVRYDFVEDHGPGNDYHGDALVHRYTEVALTRDPEVPGHIVIDDNKEFLYVVDAGKSRILKVNIQTGSKKQDLDLINEPLTEHWEMEQVSWEIFAETGLSRPSGIDIVENRLFVSDYETGEIIAYDIDTHKELGRIQTGKKGICGLVVGPDGKIWFVNALQNTVHRVDPV